MKNLLRKAFLAATAIFITGTAYAPPQQSKIESYLDTKPVISTEANQQYSHYSEYQKSRLESEESMVEMKHKIEKGDWISKIAKWYGTTGENIQLYNPQLDPKKLEVGSYIKFKVPKAEGLYNPINEENIKKNKKIVKDKTPKEFLKDRNNLGSRGLLLYLGIVPGNLEYNENKIVENFEQLKPYILKYSKKHGMNYRTVAGICKQESGFRLWTASKTGSYGPCGHTKDTYGGEHYLLGKKKEKSNPYNLDQHIEDTVKEYKQNVRMFSGYKKLALAGYNQGRNKVYRALKRVAKKRGLKEKKITTTELISFLQKTGKGNGGFVNEVLRELPKQGRKYPTLVINNVGWLADKKLIN